MIFNFDYDTIHEYTTESLLGEFLSNLLPNSEIIHDKKVPDSNIGNRPDYRIEDLKLIIEFNGKFHYTNPKTILADKKKKYVYESMGYQVFELPYWIQLRAEVIYTMFEHYKEFKTNFKFKDFTTFPHGFQSKDCPLPCDFCELGINRFIVERKFWDTKIDKLYKYVDYSLLDRIFDIDSFFSVANMSILPYFKNMFENNGVGYGYSFDNKYFPQIKWELENMW
ncbi:MAG: hypothetical protein EOL95_11905 [Bacteroidia bacterium]|nr:hypothetical protein [Bacteroidia bacterium]